MVGAGMKRSVSSRWRNQWWGGPPCPSRSATRRCTRSSDALSDVVRVDVRRTLRRVRCIRAAAVRRVVAELAVVEVRVGAVDVARAAPAVAEAVVEILIE